MTPLAKAVSRVTREPFFNYGPDRDRPFVATLAPGDVLTLRPLRIRRQAAAITIKLVDIYRYALQCRTNAAKMEKLRAIKTAKAAARDRRKLLRELRQENLTT